MTKIAPSLLAADFCSLASELQKVASADMLHLDIMDGVFVPNISFGPGLISALRPKSNLFFDVHLMIEQPERYLEVFKTAGADGITIHFESTRHAHRCITAIKSMGLQAGLSLNPGTPIDCIESLVDDLDMILIMTVDPGFGGQAFIPSSIKKINRVKEIITASKKNILLQVDGGINHTTAPMVTEAGANVLVAGVAVFKADDPAAEIAALRSYTCS